MTADELRHHITAVPFKPFYVRTIDGRRLPVQGRDFALVPPPGRHAFIFQSDGAYEVIDLTLLPSVEFGPIPADAVTQTSDPTSNP